MENFFCCICHKELIGYGNNSYPVRDGKCCDECNASIVVPIRSPGQKRHQKIKASTWWSTVQVGMPSLIGAVLVESYENQWKAYIGVGLRHDKHQDENLIYANGAKLQPHIAKQIFHDFPDIEKLNFVD